MSLCQRQLADTGVYCMLNWGRLKEEKLEEFGDPVVAEDGCDFCSLFSQFLFR